MVNTRKLGHIIAALVFATFMLCLIGWQSTVNSTIALQSKSRGLLVAKPLTSSPTADQLAGQIASAPLDQETVNAYYVAAMLGRTKLSPQQIDQLRGALTALGWRSTAAQQNILMHAVANNDMKSIVFHADGLLRRQQLTKEITELLYLFESNTVSRAAFIERLKLNPPWRAELLADRSGFTEGNRLNARADTLTAMFAAGLRPTQLELAPVVGQLLDNDQGAKSYALWRMFTGTVKGGSSLTDPSFNDALKAHEAEYYTEFPFEWRVRRGPGYSSIFSSDGTDAQVVLRWNGRGAPELLDQYFERYSGSTEIKVSGPNLDLNLIRSLEFIIDCDGTKAYFDSAKAINKNTLVLSTDDGVSCVMPRILVLGKPGNGVRSLEARFSAIELKPN